MVQFVPPTNTWIASLRLDPSIVTVSPFVTTDGVAVVVIGVEDAEYVYDTSPSKFIPPEVTVILTSSSVPWFDDVIHFISLYKH
jgi:hypothetical protein